MCCSIVPKAAHIIVFISTTLKPPSYSVVVFLTYADSLPPSIRSRIETFPGGVAGDKKHAKHMDDGGWNKSIW